MKKNILLSMGVMMLTGFALADAPQKDSDLYTRIINKLGNISPSLLKKLEPIKDQPTELKNIYEELEDIPDAYPGEVVCRITLENKTKKKVDFYQHYGDDSAIGRHKLVWASHDYVDGKGASIDGSIVFDKPEVAPKSQTKIGVVFIGGSDILHEVNGMDKLSEFAVEQPENTLLEDVVYFKKAHSIMRALFDAWGYSNPKAIQLPPYLNKRVPTKDRPKVDFNKALLLDKTTGIFGTELEFGFQIQGSERGLCEGDPIVPGHDYAIKISKSLITGPSCKVTQVSK